MLLQMVMLIKEMLDANARCLLCYNDFFFLVLDVKSGLRQYTLF